MGTENENENENLEETTEVSEEALLEVISEAVDEVTPDDVLEANDERTDEEKAADEKEAEEAAAAAEAEANQTPEEKAAAEKEAEEAAAAEAAAAEQTPEEKAAAEAEAAAAEQTPEEKAAAEAEAAAAEPDPINDPIPETTKAETATRIKSLIDIAKESTGRAEQGDELLGRITATGADAAQYANTLGFLSLYNSKDPAQRKQALAAAEGVVRELRIELGEGTADLLANHDDLNAEIEAGTLTETRAIEIATGREKSALDTARTNAANTKDANTQATNDLIAAGKAQLTTLENTLTASDPEYARLRPVFISMLKPALRKAHASEWGEVAQEIYTAVKAANPVTPAPVVKTPKNTPLRPKGSGGGSANKTGGPTSALDALDSALASM